MNAIQQLIVREQKELAAHILQSIPSQGGCVVLLGEARMGRSNILNSVTQQIQHPFALVPLADSEIEFYDTVFEKLIHYLPGSESILTNNAMNLGDRVDGIIRRLHDKHQIVTLLIDNADRFSTTEWGKRVFLRLSFFNASYALRVVLAGSDIFRQWADEKLPQKTVWENLYRSPTQLAGISLLSIQDELADRPEIARRLIELCGGHPYYLWQLTDGDILDAAFSSREVLERINIRARDLCLTEKWYEPFYDYWETFGPAARSLCYALAASPNGLLIVDAKSALKCSGFTDAEIISALDFLERTALVIQYDAKTRLQLIGVFVQWYETVTGYRQSLRPVIKTPSLPSTLAIPKVLSTEVTFFPDQDIVLVRRGHYHFSSRVGSTLHRMLKRFPQACLKAPLSGMDEFHENINNLANDLWTEFNGLEWFTSVIHAANDHHTIRFVIPENMMDFPLEMLPLDETGTRHIGTETPVSRHLLKQGRYVDQSPLRLPLPAGQKLRVLVVAAEAKSDILVDTKGCVISASGPNGRAIFLNRLQLADQIYALQSAFDAQPDLVDATFLMLDPMGPDAHSATRAEFETIIRSQQFDVLHFAGHGIYSDGFKGLVFADGAISLEQLNGMLENQKQLRFVFLNCCEGGRTDANPYINNLLGLAQTCIEAGIPAVAAMRWSIPVGVANVLAEAFYPAFFSEGLLDKAMLSAIKKLKEQTPDLNVYALAPVLLMH